MKLKVTETPFSGILRVSGNIGWENAQVLELEMARFRSSNKTSVYLFFDNVPYLSSSALGVLAGFIRSTNESCKLHMVSNDALVRENLFTCCLNELFSNRFYTDLEELENSLGLKISELEILSEKTYQTDLLNEDTEILV